MPVKQLTASQAAQYAKIMNTPLNQINKLQKETSRQNVTDAKVADLRQTNRVATLNKGYKANPAAYVSAAKNSNLDLAKINPAAYAAEQKKTVKPKAKPTKQSSYGPSYPQYNPTKQSSLGPSYLKPKTTGTRANLFAKGGMATKAKKSGINGVAIRGKTKGTLVTMTKMSGSRRSK
jgi:hypothetical protein